MNGICSSTVLQQGLWQEKTDIFWLLYFLKSEISSASSAYWSPYSSFILFWTKESTLERSSFSYSFSILCSSHFLYESFSTTFFITTLSWRITLLQSSVNYSSFSFLAFSYKFYAIDLTPLNLTEVALPFSGFIL